MGINLFKLQGMGDTLQSRLEDDKVIIDSLLNTIKGLDKEVTHDELFKLCLGNIMKDAKGHLNPVYVNGMVKKYLDNYIK